ncbi:MAG TPA: hypothetical protein VNJ29_00220 [Candidatus Nitrosotenuis sp.]|nr:hypothetical protein [Candidatus Nitrosotenuis sp.]
MIAHVQVVAGKKGLLKLKQNMQIQRENGTVYIAETGGEGGEVRPAIGQGKPSVAHAHIQYHPSIKAFETAYRMKRAAMARSGSVADFTEAEYENYVSDFRNFVREKK